MEPIETVRVGLPQDPRHLRIEAVVRRRSVSRVHFEILRDSGHALSESLKQRRVGRLGGQHTTRQQHDAIAGLHRHDPTPDLDPGLSRESNARNGSGSYRVSQSAVRYLEWGIFAVSRPSTLRAP
jgi:hypothetical protein